MKTVVIKSISPIVLINGSKCGRHLHKNSHQIGVSADSIANIITQFNNINFNFINFAFRYNSGKENL